MHRCAVVPYEGSEPYIFVSYAHKDSAQVFPIMEALYSRGYRIWYDDGIAPGSEWPENIAQHLSDSAIILACVSPNSIASDNCRREVTFALSKHKPFLGLILEPTQMSLGMEMQLSAQQCIMKYSYASQESFINKVCSCPDLAVCQDTRPVAEEETVPVQTAPEEEIPAQPPRKPEKPRKPAKPPKPPKVKKTKDPAKKVKLGKVLAMVAAGVVVLAALVFGIYSATHVRIAGEAVSKSETYFSLYDTTVTADTVRKINKLKKLEHLSFDDCHFENNALEWMKPSQTLEYVYLTDCIGVNELSWLKDLDLLYTLDLRGSGITDLLLIGNVPKGIRNLDLSENPDVTDLFPIRDCTELMMVDISGTGVTSLDYLPVEKLSDINFSNTPVDGVSALEGAANLETIDGSNSNVFSISHLAGLQQLREMNFNNCPIFDSDEAFFCLRLQSLQLANSRITTLEPFANCTVLEVVNLAGTAVSDLSVLEKSGGTLTQVDFSHMPVTAENLQFLKGNGLLTHVVLDGVPMQDLSLISGTTQLAHFSAVGCGLTDIRGISQNRDITWLRLAHNDITDISPLQSMAGNWVTLDLGYNPITDVSGLPKIRYDDLILVGTPLDAATLPELEGSVLVLSFDPAIAQGKLNTGSFYDVCLMDCPADQMVAVEDAIGAYKLTFLNTQQELLAKLAERGLDYSFLETE